MEEFEVFIKGKLINLVVITRELAQDSAWYTWFNDEETTATMQKHYFPNTREQQVKFFDSAIYGSHEHLQLGIVAADSEVLIGMISLSKIDYMNRNCEISGLIGHKDFKNLKYWLEANRLVINHAFSTLNLHRISGGAINKAASIIYTRLLGFSEEGIFREDVFKNGTYADVFRFARIVSKKE